jgi:hypothetical protein
VKLEIEPKAEISEVLLAVARAKGLSLDQFVARGQEALAAPAAFPAAAVNQERERRLTPDVQRSNSFFIVCPHGKGSGQLSVVGCQ